LKNALALALHTGQIIRIGGEDFGSGTGSQAVLQTWRQF
jgi:hypothetical protein